jgi:hypothetical protein
MAGLENLTAKLRTIKDIDATPLMLSWMKIGEEDNRRGILAGLDKDGIPMVPVKYRPIAPGPYRVNVIVKGKGVKQLNAEMKRFRLGQKASLRAGAFAGRSGIGPGWVGRNNNLTTAEYQVLGGPPLAPRDQFSRVITNYKADYARLPSGNWATTFFWDEVVSPKGVDFLKYHFDGAGRLPRRDLRGIRPEGRQEALRALQNWARLAIREHFGRY